MAYNYIFFFPFLASPVLFILLYLYFTRNFNYWKKRNIPFLKPLPFFGNSLPVLGMKQSFAIWLRDVSFKTSTEFFGVFFLDQPALVVKSPKLIKSITQTDFQFFQNRTAASYEHDKYMKNFMFFSRNPRWKIVRQKMTPLFTSGKLKLMFDLISKEADQMVEYMSGFANVNNVETKEICAKFSTNNIAKCAFGIDAQCFKHENAEFRSLARQVFDFRISTALRSACSFLKPDLATFLNYTFVRPDVLQRLSTIFKEVLDIRTVNRLVKKNDMIDILLEACEKANENIKEHFGEDVLVGQAMQFFVAGFETVASAMSFTLYELCISSEIQTRLRNEIQESIRKNHGFTYETLNEMKYLDMCVLETLRKYPGVPFLDRTCSEDYQLTDDVMIEKGTSVHIPILYLHYNSEYFPDPEKYDPERFRNKAKINVDGLTYLPFGEGPRNCIGSRFGLISVKIGIVSILSKFKLEVSDKTPIPMKFAAKNFLLLPANGIPLKFVPL